MIRFALVALLWATAAAAAEPVGCDKFKWPLGSELRLLQGSGLPAVSAADPKGPAPGAAVAVLLTRHDRANFDHPPEREPKAADTFAGLLRFAPLKAGQYQITLSEEAWIDVIQDGQFLKPVAFTGALGCEGARKSVRFEISEKPFVVQLTGAKSDSVRLVLTTAAE